jgi:fumarate reductase iron-sulfur subunit
MDTLKVSVWRGAESGEFRTYEVPRLESQTVLDVVTYIQRSLDPTLSYRFACRVGMCGSCAMTVNGKARWTCRTHVARVAEGNQIEIAPLANLPVIKDLVADMSRFFDKWAQAKGRFCARAARVAAAPGGRRRNRMRRLRRVLQRVRRRNLESRLPGTGGAQPRVDTGQ